MPFPVHIPSHALTYERYPKWGDVYWCDFGAPQSSQHSMADPHLALVISETRFTRAGTILLIPMSGAEHRKEGYLFHVLVEKKECQKLDKDTIVIVDQILCMSHKPFLPDQYYVTTFNKEVMTRIIEPLLKVLGVPNVL